MSTHTLDPEQLAAEARAALERSVDTKVSAVRNLVEQSIAVADAEQQAVTARGAFDAAWTAALRTGWTDKELRQLGLSGPGQSTGRPPRQRRAPAVAGGRDES